MKNIILSGLLATFCYCSSAQSLYTDITNADRKDILFDNFDNNDNDWYSGDNGKTKAKIKSGYYEIESLVDNPRLVYKDRIINSDGNWEVEVSIKFISGQDNNLNGLEWSWVDGDNSYLFGISGNGYYVIKKIEKGEWKVFLDWTKALVKINDFNKLTLRKVDDKFYFFVNENFVYQMPYEPIQSSKYGIHVNTKSVIKADYFRLSEILPKPPIVNWIDPTSTTIGSSTEEYLVKAKITSRTQISEISLFNSNFPLKVSTDELVRVGNDFFFQKKITLSKGENKIVLNASSIEGKAASEPVTIFYGANVILPQKQVGTQQKALTNNVVSDVDEGIPQNPINPKRFALIIGNEDYSSYQKNLGSEANVSFAVNDATTFKIYAQKVLGIDERNIFFITNATAGAMNQKIELVTKIASKLNGTAELFFYYAGHGFPDETTKIPYLIPVDVNVLNIDQGIKLSELYEKLNSCGAKRVSVFLDACFSGGGREGGLVNSRGVKVKPKEDEVIGNLIVFTASSGEQTSLPYREKNHGMFTYFLLKKLKESKGNISYADLAAYITENVSIESLRTNYQEQDPQVKTSTTLQDTWKKWKVASEK